MNMKPIYLCGPIHGRSDEACNLWRQRATQLWQGEVLDPMRRDARHRMKEPGVAAEIVEADKNDIDNCSGLLVFFDNPSVGTSMEILYAWQKGLPIVVINDSGLPENQLSLWLRYHASVIYDAWAPTRMSVVIGTALDHLRTLIQRKQQGN